MRHVLQGFPLLCRYIPNHDPGVERFLRESKSGGGELLDSRSQRALTCKLGMQMLPWAACAQTTLIFLTLGSVAMKSHFREGGWAGLHAIMHAP